VRVEVVGISEHQAVAGVGARGAAALERVVLAVGEHRTDVDLVLAGAGLRERRRGGEERDDEYDFSPNH
jgi:hypothetical protein